jgi:3-oxoacyl-[acyl-carrier protein] reductase
LARYGKLDILVNNAGAFSGGPVDEIVNADFDRLFAANVKSVLFMSQAAARALQHGGVIVNLSALNTRAPSARGALYSATKAAVESLTASLAREWGSRGIRVNAVAPGQTESDMLRLANSPESLRASPSRIALGRLGLPDDIAKVVAFLASSESSWITGETLHVNGGQRL